MLTSRPLLRTALFLACLFAYPSDAAEASSLHEEMGGGEGGGGGGGWGGGGGRGGRGGGHVRRALLDDSSPSQLGGLSNTTLLTLLVMLPFVFPALFLSVFMVFLCRGKQRDFSNLFFGPGDHDDGKLRSPTTHSHPPKEGQMTVVVTDIQASTKLWQLCPEDMDAAQAMHDQLLRNLLREHQGYEMMTEGDCFIVVFHTPQHALAWCVAIQKALHDAEYSDALLGRFSEVYGSLGTASSLEMLGGAVACSSTLDVHDSIDVGEGQNVHDSVDDEGGGCVRGLRVRIGLHTGPITSVREDEKTKRWIYDGLTVRIARAISDAAAGGQILTSGETMAALAGSGGIDESKENGCAVYSMGRHQLSVSLANEGLRTSVRYGVGSDVSTATPTTMDILRREMLENGEQAPSQLQTAKKTAHRCEILYAVPSSLHKRAGHFHRLDTVRQLTPSFFDAPRKENLTVVFTYIRGGAALEGWDKEVYSEAVAVMKACLRFTLAESGGYEIRETQGNFLLGFKSPTAAAEWCVLSQHALLNLQWNKELLSRPQAAFEKENKEMIWCGLRIGMGICTGSCNSITPCKRTGRAEYFGHVLNQTARIACCAAGGQVLCSSLSLNRISSQSVKFFHVKDLGTYLLKGIQTPEHLHQISSPPLDRRSFPELTAPRAPPPEESRPEEQENEAHESRSEMVEEEEEEWNAPTREALQARLELLITAAARTDPDLNEVDFENLIIGWAKAALAKNKTNATTVAIS